MGSCADHLDLALSSIRGFARLGARSDNRRRDRWQSPRNPTLAIDLAGAEIRHEEKIAILVAAAREAVITDGSTAEMALSNYRLKLTAPSWHAPGSGNRTVQVHYPQTTLSTDGGTLEKPGPRQAGPQLNRNVIQIEES